MMETEPSLAAAKRALARLDRAASAPVSPAGLALFRVMLGLLMLGATLRFCSKGWIQEFYLKPAYHFTYLGFDWVRPWPEWGMYTHFAAMALSALTLAVGFYSRLSALLFCVLFTYAELIEKATYLNHYYLVSVLTLMLALLPSGAGLSIDAWRRHGVRRSGSTVPAWVYWYLRAQVTIVYFYAGAAKLNLDWLLDAEPLRIWLAARRHIPMVGMLLALPLTGYVMSYLGALYDLTIPLWLSLRKTRRAGFALVLMFHTSVWLLFPIGVFSWVMIVASTVFFSSEWPHAWLRLAPDWLTTPLFATPVAPSRRLALRGHLLLQSILPLRFLLYPGDVNWHEQGFRFSWRVMLIEKSGQVEFRVRGADGLSRVVHPERELTALQYKMMSTQPDMIQQYARHLRTTAEAKSGGPVEVFADSRAALNGRRSQVLIDPSVDLAAVPWSLMPKTWIRPLESRRIPGRDAAPR